MWFLKELKLQLIYDPAIVLLGLSVSKGTEIRSLRKYLYSLYLSILWHCPSLGLEWKLTFSSPGPLLSFQFADIMSAALSQHHLRIWNSSTGIPSPALALFAVMLPKAYLNSHSRMSGSRWVITPSWLSGLLRSFLYSSSVYSCHLLISSGSVRSIPFFCPLLSASLHEMFLWYL